MRIVHVCLACCYIEGMGYQENILPKYHAEKHDVFVIASDYAFDATGKVIEKDKKEYCNEYGVQVKVLERSSRYGYYSRFNDYDRVYDTLCEIDPDIIFCHGGQFVALKDVIKYCKKHRNVRLFIDQHADYYNTPVTTLRKRIAHYWIYGYWMRKAVRYAEKFWGVTPWRCEYLNDVYGIPKSKIGFLPMGGDDEKIRFDERAVISSAIREENGIATTDFLLVTGGKINAEKHIDVLMKAVSELNRDDIKLLVFGQPNDQMKEDIEKLSTDPHIRYIGWIPSEKVYDYFMSADMVIFPGTHSVLWEQACACGVPGIFKDWPGMHHVNVDGSAVFLHDNHVEEMKRVIMDIYEHREKLDAMRLVAIEKGIPTFSYRKIAQKAIFEDSQSC